MEIESTDATVARAPLCFNLLMLIKKAQAQHGLRHADYARYRCVCVVRGWVWVEVLLATTLVHVVNKY